MNNKKIKFEFKDRAAIGPNVMRFATNDKENSIVAFFMENPSEKMLEFLRNMGTIIKSKSSTEPGQWVYEAEASLEDIKTILAFSDWGFEEIYQKSIFPDQTKGVFCSFRNEITTAYLKAVDLKPLEAGIACTIEGYRLISKQDFIDGINALWEEERSLHDRLSEIQKERKQIVRAYASAHLPETGYAIGQKVTVTDQFTGKEVTAFFAGADVSTIHPDGNLMLMFYPAKKDGTPSKRIDRKLTQYFKIKEKQ